MEAVIERTISKCWACGKKHKDIKFFHLSPRQQGCNYKGYCPTTRKEILILYKPREEYVETKI